MTLTAYDASSRRRLWLGYGLSAACLVWVFHDVNWNLLFRGLRNMQWLLLVPAIAADIGSYIVQAARWSLLLRPLGRITVVKSTMAIYAALFVNEVLPLRVGEVLRGYLAGNWASVPLTHVFSSIAAERFLDGVWMVLAFGIVVMNVPLPRYLVDAEEALAFIIAASAALLVIIITRAPAASAGPAVHSTNTRLTARVAGWMGEAMTALRLIGSSRFFYAASALSAVPLVLQTLSFWLVMQAYGIPLSLWHGTAVFLIVRLGVTVPGAPSNVGTYQFFTVLGLMLFGIDKNMATGFSIIVFLILTIPLWVIGLFAFGRAGLDFRTVRQSVIRSRNQECGNTMGGKCDSLPGHSC